MKNKNIIKIVIIIVIVLEIITAATLTAVYFILKPSLADLFHKSHHKDTANVPQSQDCSTKFKPRKPLIYKGFRGFSALKNAGELFPLNRGRRFAGDVVDDSTGAGNFVYDSQCDRAEGFMRNRRVFAGHEVRRAHRA